MMWPENGLLQTADRNNCLWKMCFAQQAKQAVTKCNIDQVPWRPMTSLSHSHNVLNMIHVWWCNKQQNQNARHCISTSLISVTHVTRSQNPKDLKKRPKPCVYIRITTLAVYMIWIDIWSYFVLTAATILSRRIWYFIVSSSFVHSFIIFLCVV